MTSKERVLTAVNLAQPDRVPIDLLPNRWVEERLHCDLGTTNHMELLRRLHCDIVDLRGVVDPVYRGPVSFSLRPLSHLRRSEIPGSLVQHLLSLCASAH